MGTILRCYSELVRLPSFEERFEYLKLCGTIGEETFGFRRYMNQSFYKSTEWRHIRNRIILRDNGCDLACEDYPIRGSIYIHHIRPITEEDIFEKNQDLLDPENLICMSLGTHNRLHYEHGDSKLPPVVAERKPGDTTLW